MKRNMTFVGNGQAFTMYLVPGTTCWTSSRTNALAPAHRREAERKELEASLRMLRNKLPGKRADIPMATSADFI